MIKTAAVIASVLLTAAALRAQPALFVGAHFVGASLTTLDTHVADFPAEFGSGFGTHAGLSFGDRFGLLVSADRSIRGVKSDHTDLRQWDVLGRMTWFEIGPASVYLTAGLSRNSASLPPRGDSPFGDLNPTAGLTGQMPLFSKLAVAAGFLWTLGKFDDGQGGSTPLVQRAFFGASVFLFGGK